MKMKLINKMSRDQIWNEIEDKVWYTVSEQINNWIWNRVRDQISAQVRGLQRIII